MHTIRRPFSARVAGRDRRGQSRPGVSRRGAGTGSSPVAAGRRVSRRSSDRRTTRRSWRAANASMTISCRACHGADLRGGDMGGPNLLRSNVMLNDDNGDLLRPILQGSRARMPPIDLAARGRGSRRGVMCTASWPRGGRRARRPRRSRPGEYPRRRRDARAGLLRREMQHVPLCRRATCRALAARTVRIPLELQNLWVAGGRPSRSTPPCPRGRVMRWSVVTLASGQVVEGRLDRIDDFMVSVIRADGRRQYVSARRQPATGRHPRSARGAQAAAADLHRPRHPRRHGLPGNGEMKPFTADARRRRAS